MGYKEKRAALMAEAQAFIEAKNFDEFAKKKAEIEALDKEHEAEAQAQANFAALNVEPKIVPAFGPVSARTDIVPTANITTDVYGSDEYRRAFMAAIVSGVEMPREFVNSNQSTTTGDVGAVIPTTILNRIVEKMEKTGEIWRRITHTNFQGGLSVPTSSAKPTASWASERSTADTQKKTVSSITFTYHKLICKVAISFEASIVTLDVFEQTVADNIAVAMIKTVETAAISGNGSGKPKGILAETAPAGQAVEITKNGTITFAKLAECEAALPMAYDDGAVWVMTKNTFVNNVVGIVDANGNPIVRDVIGVNGKPMNYILGREVVLVSSDYLSNYAQTVASDTVVAFIFNWADYIANTNYAVTVREYIDEDTDDKVKKAIMLVDGKAVDVNSLVTLTKKSS